MKSIIAIVSILPFLFFLFSFSTGAIIAYEYPTIQIDCNFDEPLPLIKCLNEDCSDNLTAVHDGRILTHHAIVRENQFLKSIIVNDMSTDNRNFRVFLSNISDNENFIDRFILYTDDLCIEDLSVISSNLQSYETLKLFGSNRIIIAPYDDVIYDDLIQQNKRIGCYSKETKTIGEWLVYYDKPNSYCTNQWSSYALMFGSGQVPKVSVTLYFFYLLSNYSLTAFFHILIYIVLLGLLLILPLKANKKGELNLFYKPTILKILFPLIFLGVIVFIWGGMFIADFLIFFFVIYTLLSSYSYRYTQRKTR